MTVGPVEGIGAGQWPTPTEAPARASFGDLVLQGIERLEQTQDAAADLAVDAATGDLQNLHDYTIAASEAAVTTQLTVAVRNRAVEAFTEIMRMPIG
ncbi:flagellar hook-basal body complex protein FliE [Aeromicrobium phragmitis]|uniref:Flagellar hook-basal body complex protein FliE n=1 Tax=Aeromicrobium phragmitis TaxID=2478914 RepID=A0A3L8PMA2_9ACTN|nr:flagellar hook-basal body complex protein FliE [Aeromicrobium phragmitis]RLV56465.1 flagellar hook-basal body complex protein FliE [Aeromicrobium phragmitis]